MIQKSLWHVSLLIPVYKKGDPSLCTNYRGIALMSVCAKLYNRILLARIRDGLDNYLRPNQNGFRPLRSTAQHVLTWKRIHEEVCSMKDSRLITVFIDFTKAFDSIDWNYIDNILLAYDVPNEIVDAVMSVYYGAKAAVKYNGTISDYFDLGVGILQGDTLAPYLFIIVLDWVMRNAIPDPSISFTINERVGTRTRTIVEAKYLTGLDFADDIVLISSDEKKVQSMVLLVENWTLKAALNINASKTKYFLYWSKLKSLKNVLLSK